MLCVYHVGHFLYVLNAGLQQQRQQQKQQQQQHADQVTIKPTLTVRKLRRHAKTLLPKLKKWSLRKLYKNNNRNSL